jgi:hypothetical protein
LLSKQKLLLLVAASLLVQSAFFLPAPMPAYAGDPAMHHIIINEIEINAAESGGSVWIELLNAGDAPVSLSNLSLAITTGGGNVTQVLFNADNGDSAATLPAQRHHVAPLPINLDHSNLVSLQLFEDGTLIDEVEGLNDNIADGHTWQRYPDGLDTGHFEDWVFAESTRGQDNGNLGKAIAECYLDPFCMTLDTPMHKLHVLDVNDTAFTVDTFSTSSVTGLNLHQEEKKLEVKLSKSSKESELAFIHLTFPKTLLSGNFLVSMDQSDSQHPFFAVANDTHSRVIIEYEPGDRTIEIVGTNVVPEFGTASVLLTVAALTFASILAWRRFSAITRSRPGSKAG